MSFISNKNKINIMVWILIIVPVVMCYSSFVSEYFYGTDFPVYYLTAKRMVDPASSIKDIYQIEAQDNLLPEKNFKGNYFIYSPVIAPLFSPLGFLPYYTAKTTFIFLNIMAYFLAIKLVLKLINRNEWIYFIQAIILMWVPFLINTWGAQVNGFIFLLIVGSIKLAKTKQYGSAGTLLGFSVLFKIFPFFIALLLGFVNRRIVITTITLFVLALLAPGTFEWLKAIQTVSAGHTPVYLFLSQYGFGWVLLFSFWVALVSVYCLLKAKTNDLLTIFAYSIPAAFAMMPVVQYHHLIILVATYIIVLNSQEVFSKNFILKAIFLVASLYINLQIAFKFLPSTYWSVLFLWISMSYILINRNDKINNNQYNYK